jgi:alpha-ketoglutarate-dependent taurine dioxygenase
MIYPQVVPKKNRGTYFIDMGRAFRAPPVLHPAVFTHPGIHTQTFTEGDLLIWDNRSLVHRALHRRRRRPPCRTA